MLIHGAWLTGNSWDNFAEHFRGRGYEVSAPDWPRKQGDVGELREHADEVAGLGVKEIVDHYESQIRALPEPPLLVGHSYGGLFVELLLDRGLGRAGVAMSPAPPKGILVLPFSTLKSAAPALTHPSTRHGIVDLTLEEFRTVSSTRSRPRTRRPPTRSTPSPRPARSSTRRVLPTFTCTRRPRSISGTASAPRC